LCGSPDGAWRNPGMCAFYTFRGIAFPGVCYIKFKGVTFSGIRYITFREVTFAGIRYINYISHIIKKTRHHLHTPICHYQVEAVRK